jgi:hypothetical protein
MVMARIGLRMVFLAGFALLACSLACSKEEPKIVEPAIAAGGAPSSKPTPTPAGAAGAAPVTRRWHCEQQNANCVCIGIGTEGDTCDKPKPPCCFALSAKISDCQCVPEDSNACTRSHDPANGFVMLPTCPPPP